VFGSRQLFGIRTHQMPFVIGRGFKREAKR